MFCPHLGSLLFKYNTHSQQDQETYLNKPACDQSTSSLQEKSSVVGEDLFCKPPASSHIDRSTQSDVNARPAPAQFSTVDSFRRIRPGIIVTKNFDEAGVPVIQDVYFAEAKRTSMIESGHAAVERHEVKTDWSLDEDAHEEARGTEKATEDIYQYLKR